MNYVGIDPSSSRVGIAVIGPVGVFTAEWDVRGHPGKWQADELPIALWRYQKKLDGFLRELRPAVAAIEQLSVSHNMDTVRKIAYFEAASIIACMRKKVAVYSVKTTTARKRVLGKGNITKPDTIPMLESLIGAKLGPDEADAVLFAMYAQEEYNSTR